MTGEAWMMLGATWTVVFFFTARFFYKILTIPPVKEGDRVEGAAEIEDVSEHD